MLRRYKDNSEANEIGKTAPTLSTNEVLPRCEILHLQQLLDHKVHTDNKIQGKHIET